MVPWTPSNHREGPPITSLQSDTGKGGSPAVLSRYAQSLWAARQRIYHRSMALTPRHIHGLQHPSAYSEINRSTTLCLKTLANVLTSLEAGSLVPCGFLWSSAFVWRKKTNKLVSKIPRSFWSSMNPPFVTSFRNERAEAVVTRHFTRESLPNFSKTKEIRKTLTVFSNSTETPEHLVYEQMSFSIVNTCETYYK